MQERPYNSVLIGKVVDREVPLGAKSGERPCERRSFFVEDVVEKGTCLYFRLRPVGTDESVTVRYDNMSIVEVK
jgi:hypothetical protein